MNYIIKICKKHDMTQMELSYATGISQPRISRLSRLRGNEELYTKMYVAEKQAIERLDYELDMIGGNKPIVFEQVPTTLNDTFKP